MKSTMRTAQVQLTGFLGEHQLTAGMYVRVHGDHLIVGREESRNGGDSLTNDDRVRLTRLSASRYGLSVKRHTGRWEKTPFSGSMREMVEAMLTFMQHLVAPY